MLYLVYLYSCCLHLPLICLCNSWVAYISFSLCICCASCVYRECAPSHMCASAAPLLCAPAAPPSCTEAVPPACTDNVRRLLSVHLLRLFRVQLLHLLYVHILVSPPVCTHFGPFARADTVSPACAPTVPPARAAAAPPVCTHFGVSYVVCRCCASFMLLWSSALVGPPIHCHRLFVDVYVCTKLGGGANWETVVLITEQTFTYNWTWKGSEGW